MLTLQNLIKLNSLTWCKICELKNSYQLLLRTMMISYRLKIEEGLIKLSLWMIQRSKLEKSFGLKAQRSHIRVLDHQNPRLQWPRRLSWSHWVSWTKSHYQKRIHWMFSHKHLLSTSYRKQDLRCKHLSLQIFHLLQNIWIKNTETYFQKLTWHLYQTSKWLNSSGLSENTISNVNHSKSTSLLKRLEVSSKN